MAWIWVECSAYTHGNHKGVLNLYFLEPQVLYLEESWYQKGQFPKVNQLILGVLTMHWGNEMEVSCSVERNNHLTWPVIKRGSK